MKDPEEPKFYEKDKYAKNQILNIRASSQWRHWLHCRASEHGLSQSALIDHIIADWVRLNKKPTPPRRWPPEVS